MKKIVLCLSLALAACIISGQPVNETILRAVSLSQRGESDEAAGLLAGVAEIKTNAGLLLLRGNIFLKAGRLREARSDFMAAENMLPGSGMYGLATCAATEGDVRATVSYLTVHLQSPYRKSEPSIMLDKAFSTVASSPEWKNLWRKDWYKGFERKSWEIDHYLKSGRPDLATEAWSQLSGLYPEMPVTEYCQARIMMSSGKYREASEILARLAEQKDAPPDWIDALAEAYSGDGSYYAAATAVTRLINAGYPDPQLLLRRSQMLLKAGDRRAARQDLENYLTIDPDNTEALGLIGRMYAEEGAIYEALPYLNTNVDRHPGEPSAFRLRGDAWMAARSWERAAEDYTMSLDLDPANGQVNLKMGIALVNNGRADEACYYLRKARSLGEKGATEYLARYCIK